MVDMALLDNLRHGADVISTDGVEVGKLHTVLVDERSDEVTRIVVNAGPHFPAPGFGAPDLIAIDIDEVADAQEGAVILRCTEAKFRAMPLFSDYQFFSTSRKSAGKKFDPVDAAVGLAAAFASVGGVPVPLQTFKRAKFERHMFNDAPVWRDEPYGKIGEVERVLVDEEDQEIEALVLNRGELFAADVILPIEYVVEVFGGVVHVDITDSELGALEPFDPGE